MTSRKLLGAMVVAGAAISAVPASAQSTAFGPVESRTFHWKPGTAIERPPANCQSNIDWLLVRSPGAASSKTVDVTPKVTQLFEKSTFPASSCVAPDCIPLFIKVTERDAVGSRKVTLKHADGRTATTTFDVVENAGRCDYPKK